MNNEITDNIAYRFPISMKGIVIIDSKFVLLKNERDEWELPGGKLELGEDPQECAIREIKEELQVDVDEGTIIDNWVYTIKEGVIVYISTYGFKPLFNVEYEFSHEHKEAGSFTFEEVQSLKMPDGYKNSINKWYHELLSDNELVR